MPLTYQWSKDDVEIPGATSASYTTQNAETVSDFATVACYQVTISNGETSLASNTVVINEEPRKSKQGDLRYLLDEQVDIPGLQVTELIHRGFAQFVSYPNAIDGPINMGYCGLADNCSWDVFASGLPSPMSGQPAQLQG